MLRKFAGFALVVCIGCGSHAPTPPTGSNPTPPKDQERPPTAVAGPTAPPKTGADSGRRPPIEAPIRRPSPIPSPAADPEVEWYSKLKSGMLKQYVPPTMQWKVPATVTVVVGGEKADTSSALPNATGSATIKVARQMRVIVFCPDNPDEFVITPEPGTAEVQYVPEDGTTTWNWSVTPRYTGKSQKIAIRAWVLYPGSQNAQHELPVYTATVDVHVPSFAECLKRLFEGDPDYWLKYGLPGGAGFVFMSGAIAAIWKWLRRKKTGPKPADA
jgi:hypothetical protein